MTNGVDRFAGVVKQLRLANRLTQEELAERSGLTVRSVRYVECGRVRSPRPESARLLGSALGLSGSDLDEFMAKAREDYWTARRDTLTDSLPAEGGGPARCLPRRHPDIIGRAAEIERLRTIVDAADPAAVAIDGMAGVGKTTLAVDVAYRLAGRCPDAHLYLDLQGHSEQSPIEPAEAVGFLLRQLGLPPRRIPAGLHERTALWRTELTRRRCLVLLDNAHDSRQVTPLLPPAGTITLITSRRRLTGLDGVPSLSLDRLRPAAAVEMMALIAGDRVRLEAAAAAEVADLCGQLPLALCLAAARLVHRPSWSVADLVSRLRRARRPATALTADGRSISAAFTLSYEQLRAPAQRAFRLLGVHPAGTFDVLAAAAVTGLPVVEADDIVEQLVDAHMLDAAAAGRYRFHDLLRDYAGSLLDRGETAERDRAQCRMFDYYLHTTVAATAEQELGYGRTSVDYGVRSVGTPAFANRRDANSWLHENCLTVASLTELAEAAGRHHVVFRLAQALWPYLYHHGPFSLATTVHERGLRAAEALADDAMRAMASDRLASAYSRTGRWTDSLAMMHQAVLLWRRSDDPANLALSLANFAGVLGRMGRFADVVACTQEARALTIDAEPIAAVPARRVLAIALRHLGRHEEALAENRFCLATAIAAGQEPQVSKTLAEIAFNHLALGHARLAILLLRRVCSLGSTSPYGVAEALSATGTAYHRLGSEPEAMHAHHSAVTRMREFGEPSSLAMVLNDFGVTLLATRQLTEAADAHREALVLAEGSGMRFEIARAHAGIGDAVREVSPEEARRHHRAALALFDEMGAPERQAMAARVAG